LNHDIVLKAINISKSFPGVQALKDVSIDIIQGEVYAILGENGAGKSTLIKILGGIYRTDSGEIEINGKQVKINNVQDAERNGIAVIHQELCLALNISVAENVFLGREPVHYRTKFIQFNKMYSEAQKIMEDVGLKVNSKAIVNDLSIAQRQMVAIARVLSRKSNIIIMDEPTSSLTSNEVNSLFKIIKTLKEKGVSIIYITHKLDELYEIADRVTVLRDGEYIGTKNVAETKNEELIHMMIGREPKQLYKFAKRKHGEKILQVQKLSTGTFLKDISFDLSQYEILGFAGLVGAGRTETVRAIFGIDPISSGKIFLEGKQVKIKKPKDAIDLGVVLVPENRKEHGLFLGNEVGYNITISILKELISYLKVYKEKENNIIDKYIKKLNIKTPTHKKKVIELSGGNQQKVVIAKWLCARPKILILDEPTRGIDIGAKVEIYELIEQLSKEGVGIIIISSELQEIINISTRVVVMHEGKVAGILEGEDITQNRIMQYATGGN
jgi:ABC-type sugar transport system ATPase subunit